MRRLVAFLFGITFMSAAAVAATCPGVDVPALVGGVPYYGARMVPMSSPGNGAVALVHRDDARIRLTVRAETAQPLAPTRRSEFIKFLRASLRDSVPRSAGEPIIGIVPYDPVSWSAQTRSGNQDALASEGAMTVMQSPTCRVVAAWSVVETPVLVGRVKEFASALDDLRARIGEVSVPVEFLPEANVPTGNNAILYGLMLPLAAAGLLFYALRHMLNLSDPSRNARSVAAVGALVAGATVAYQMPYYLEGLPDFRFTDVGGLLAVSGLLLAAMSAFANGKVTLAALAVTLCAGLTIGIGATMGWTPEPGLGLAVAGALFLCALVSLWLWNGQSYKRVVRVPKEGKTA